VSADGEIEILRDMIACGAEAITIDERTSITLARKIADQIIPGYPIGGNINPFSVIHVGPPKRIWRIVQQVIEAGVDMVAPGCDFWLETSTEHVKTFVEAVAAYGTVM
jgi:uroporphyrinogen-III decarboxylase